MAEGPVCRFAHSGPGIRRLLQHMERAGVTQAVCESTGGYERLLVSRLRTTAIQVPVAHPLRVRAFARACGYEAKTDRLEEEYQALLQRSVALCRQATLYRSVPGVGSLTAAMRVAFLPAPWGGSMGQQGVNLAGGAGPVVARQWPQAR